MKWWNYINIPFSSINYDGVNIVIRITESITCSVNLGHYQHAYETFEYSYAWKVNDLQNVVGSSDYKSKKSLTRHFFHKIQFSANNVVEYWWD